jgi:aspartyl-tRNA(Asn)/glutamyl-tRNA(Gln) amidotransferase subunit A
MSDLVRLSAAEQAAALASGEVSSVDLVQAHLDRTPAVDGAVHAYLDVSAEKALATAREVDDRRAAGDDVHALAGVPIAVKDNFVTRGQVTTAASRMLEGWVPPYDATVVERLRAAGLPILGKTNMDEFAMGSSTEHSAFGPTHNPWDLDRIPGGSGGGSAAAVASFQAPLALGSDTGGSIRQPGAVTGTVGVKPTYGGMSRYGVIAMASSLDQPGPAARTVLDAALLHEVVGGHDPLDSTSLTDPVAGLADAARSGSLDGLRIGVVTQLGGEGYEPGVRASFDAAIELATAAGATVTEVSCPSFDYALAAYYLIHPAEASSNLARYDGMRYGLRVEPTEGPVTAERVMAATRGAGFASAFAQVDVLLSPTAPTTAFPLGAKLDDPLAMYLNDVATIPANLAGVPAMSLPSGLSDDGLPVGLQIIAPARADHLMYKVGGALERALIDSWGGPLLDRAPTLEEIAR